MRRTWCIQFLALTILLIGVFSAAAGSETANGDLALSRAAAFFQAVNWTASGARKADLISTDSRSLWSVTVGDLTAEIDESGSRVLSAMNYPAFLKRDADTVSISEQTANSLVAKYLQVAGCTLDQAQLVSSKPTSNSSDPGYMRWEIRYRRVLNGFPFHGDFILVNLNPDDGSLMSFGYRFDTPVPESTSVVLSRGDADSAARQYLRNLLGCETGSLIAESLLIVKPDQYWDYVEAGTIPSLPTMSSRLAWVVEFDAPWEKTEVWVDSATGEILGGVKSLDTPKSARPRPQLEATDTLTIRNTGTKSKPLRIGMRSDDGRAIAAAFSSLKPVNRPLLDTSISMVFVGKDRSYTLAYAPSGHRLMLTRKSYRGKEMNGRLAWETSAGFEKVLAKYLKK